MTVSELLKSLDFCTVWSVIELTFPDEVKNRSNYEDMFSALCSKEPEYSDDIFLYVKYYDIPEGSMYGDVSLFVPDDSMQLYSVITADWNKILGSEVCYKSLEEYTGSEIVANLLYELSFLGFTEEQISAKVNSWKNIDPGEYISADEVYRELDIYDSRSDEEKAAEEALEDEIDKLNSKIDESYLEACKRQSKKGEDLK